MEALTGWIDVRLTTTCSDNFNNHKDTVMGNTHSQQERLGERSEEFQLATKSSRQLQRSRPSPLVIEDVNSVEQPRIR